MPQWFDHAPHRPTMAQRFLNSRRVDFPRTDGLISHKPTG